MIIGIARYEESMGNCTYLAITVTFAFSHAVTVKLANQITFLNFCKCLVASLDALC